MTSASLDDDVEPIPEDEVTRDSVERVKEAYRLRAQRFEEADKIRKAQREQASAEFANVVRAATKTRTITMSELAKALGINRVTLHEIMRRTMSDYV